MINDLIEKEGKNLEKGRWDLGNRISQREYFAKIVRLSTFILLSAGKLSIGKAHKIIIHTRE